jgi:hypothetical protein
MKVRRQTTSDDPPKQRLSWAFSMKMLIDYKCIIQSALASPVQVFHLTKILPIVVYKAHQNAVILLAYTTVSEL